ncbi:MAG: type III pantothenate kinase [Planctomycetota bacterium]
MLLAVDVGNLATTMGLYQEEHLGPRWRISTVMDRTADEYGLDLLGLLAHRGVAPPSIGGVVLACVVPPLTEVWHQVCESYLKARLLVVGAGIKTGMRIRYEDPRQVGADRVAQAVAATRLFGVPACIVDFGTATIFDAIDANEDYLGGAIAPGLRIAADALYRRTAKLPRVEIEPPPAAIGSNVTHSIQAGLLYGHVGLVEGLVRRFKEALGEGTRVIATGGMAPLIARETTVIDHVAPWLTLDGLRLIYEMNR